MILVSPIILLKTKHTVLQVETGHFHTVFLVMRDCRSESEIIVLGNEHAYHYESHVVSKDNKNVKKRNFSGQ